MLWCRVLDVLCGYVLFVVIMYFGVGVCFGLYCYLWFVVYRVVCWCVVVFVLVL